MFSCLAIRELDPDQVGPRVEGKGTSIQTLPQHRSINDHHRFLHISRVVLRNDNQCRSEPFHLTAPIQTIETQHLWALGSSARRKLSKRFQEPTAQTCQLGLLVMCDASIERTLLFAFLARPLRLR